MPPIVGDDALYLVFPWFNNNVAQQINDNAEIIGLGPGVSSVKKVHLIT